MRNESWIVGVVALLCAGACGPALGTDATAGGDGSSDDGEATRGSASTQTTGGEATSGSESTQTTGGDDPWQLCDAATIPELPADAGCPGPVPKGELDADGAGSIFGRATHEVDHIREAMQPEAQDSGHFEIDGDELRASSDSGYVVGGIAREQGADLLCVRVTFACWTGGHGGFGPSGLDGRVDVLVDGEIAQARGELGLVEGGALSGAPSAQVWLSVDSLAVEGTVGDFAF